MSKYFTHLKLPFEADMEAFARFEANPNGLGHVMKDPAQVDPRVLDVLAKAKITIQHAEAFYTPPRGNLNIHIDSSRESDLAKLNFAYGAEGSLMNWWALRDPSFSPVVRQTGIGTNYLFFPHHLCKIVGSTKIGRPTIVNAGRPHSVLNQTNEGRWVASLVLCCAESGSTLTLEEATARLTEYKA